MSLRFEPASVTHARIVARSMRARDIEEVMAGWGDPERAIVSAIAVSPYARTVFWELEPLAIYGLKNLTVLGSSAQVWCFGTDAIDRHPTAFLKASRSVLSDLFRRADILTNYVDATDYAAIRWLSWLGATASLPPQMMGGRLFAQFFLVKPKVSTCQQA